jgi:hypothetical protein
MVGQFATEAYQATYYKQMLQLLACDPNVRVINIFHLVDEPNLAGWQSGLYWVGNGTPVAKQSATVIATWMSQTHGACQGKPVSWTPAPAAAPTTSKPVPPGKAKPPKPKKAKQHK